MKTGIIKYLLNKSIESLLIRSLGVCLLFLMHMLLTRNMDTENYGVFSYALSLAGLFALILPIGLPSVLVRYIPEYSVKRSWSCMRGLIIRSHQIVVVTTVTVCFIIYFVSSYLDSEDSIIVSIKYAAILTPIMVLSGLRSSVFKGLHNVRGTLIPDEIVVPLLTIIAAVYLLKFSDIIIIFEYYLIAWFLSTVVGAYWLFKALPTDIHNIISKFDTLSWLKVSVPMLIGGLSSTVLRRTDVLMIGAFLSMSDVALYSVSNRIATLSIFVLSAIEVIAVPAIAKAYYSHNNEEFTKVVSFTRIFSVLGALPFAFAMLFYPEYLLSFFGDVYSESSVLILQLLAIAKFTRAVSSPSGFVLLMTGNEKLFARMLFIVALINLVGNYIAIQVYGVMGVVYVTLLCMIIINTWQWIIARKIVIH